MGFIVNQRVGRQKTTKILFEGVCVSASIPTCQDCSMVFHVVYSCRLYRCSRQMIAVETTNCRDGWHVVSDRFLFSPRKVCSFWCPFAWFQMLGYIYIYVYIYICIYVYMYICIYVYLYICIFVYLYKCLFIYLYMYICKYVSMYICMYVNMYICNYMNICKCVYMYICIYVYM